MSVRHALLALLSEGPKYGLRLRQEFEERTGEVWPLNTGQVYTTVQRLERDGLVESDPDDTVEGPQKLFQITEAGAQELDVWLRTPPPADAPPRDELVIKVLVGLRLPGVDVRDVLQTHRRHTIAQMKQYTRLKEDAADDLSLLLVADAQLFRLESVVRWLDAAEGRLKHHAPVAPAAPADAAPSTRTRRLRGATR
ncbi:PadR family transcriptional regulator [Streptomyces sp. YC504]|uniref:PadR family transcriptional regulator n=1 Tax=Streptomyces mesophilus TaxID=1775132 RepID=A0A6G4XUW8_9ACTN|nr:helix-turn-helix transcriptional regulator [Streptomyces mesophilus]NGO80992.1 PadR family transcriptional regulator [Streptomyces mesophilus]